MGVRPPQQNNGDAPEIIAFGIAALDEHLERMEPTFPMTDAEVLEATGDPRVPYDVSGNEMRLSDALAETGASTFETRQEFLNALHPVFEEKREQSNSGLIGRIRSFLPF